MTNSKEASLTQRVKTKELDHATLHRIIVNQQDNLLRKSSLNGPSLSLLCNYLASSLSTL